MLPACTAAYSPKPQKKSARTAPLIAPPVSCANIRRLSGSLVFGMWCGGEEHRHAERDGALIDRADDGVRTADQGRRLAVEDDALPVLLQPPAKFRYDGFGLRGGVFGDDSCALHQAVG